MKTKTPFIDINTAFTQLEEVAKKTADESPQRSLVELLETYFSLGTDITKFWQVENLKELDAELKKGEGLTQVAIQLSDISSKTRISKCRTILDVLLRKDISVEKRIEDLESDASFQTATRWMGESTLAAACLRKAQKQALQMGGFLRYSAQELVAVSILFDKIESLIVQAETTFKDNNDFIAALHALHNQLMVYKGFIVNMMQYFLTNKQHSTCEIHALLSKAFQNTEYLDQHRHDIYNLCDYACEEQSAKVLTGANDTKLEEPVDTTTFDKTKEKLGIDLKDVEGKTLGTYMQEYVHRVQESADLNLMQKDPEAYRKKVMSDVEWIVTNYKDNDLALKKAMENYCEQLASRSGGSLAMFETVIYAIVKAHYNIAYLGVSDFLHGLAQFELNLNTRLDAIRQYFDVTMVSKGIFQRDQIGSLSLHHEQGKDVFSMMQDFSGKVADNKGKFSVLSTVIEKASSIFKTHAMDSTMQRMQQAFAEIDKIKKQLADQMANIERMQGVIHEFQQSKSLQEVTGNLNAAATHNDDVIRAIKDQMESLKEFKAKESKDLQALQSELDLATQAIKQAKEKNLDRETETEQMRQELLGYYKKDENELKAAVDALYSKVDPLYSQEKLNTEQQEELRIANQKIDELTKKLEALKKRRADLEAGKSAKSSVAGEDPLAVIESKLAAMDSKVQGLKSKAFKEELSLRAQMTAVSQSADLVKKDIDKGKEALENMKKKVDDFCQQLSKGLDICKELAQYITVNLDHIKRILAGNLGENFADGVTRGLNHLRGRIEDGEKGAAEKALQIVKSALTVAYSSQTELPEAKKALTDALNQRRGIKFISRIFKAVNCNTSTTAQITESTVLLHAIKKYFDDKIATHNKKDGVKPWDFVTTVDKKCPIPAGIAAINEVLKKFSSDSNFSSIDALKQISDIVDRKCRWIPRGLENFFKRLSIAKQRGMTKEQDDAQVKEGQEIFNKIRSVLRDEVQKRLFIAAYPDEIAHDQCVVDQKLVTSLPSCAAAA